MYDDEGLTSGVDGSTRGGTIALIGGTVRAREDRLAEGC